LETQTIEDRATLKPGKESSCPRLSTSSAIRSALRHRAPPSERFSSKQWAEVLEIVRHHEEERKKWFERMAKRGFVGYLQKVVLAARRERKTGA